MCLNMYFGIYMTWLVVYVCIILINVYVYCHETNQPSSQLVGKCEIYFVGIAKSGFTTNLVY